MRTQHPDVVIVDPRLPEIDGGIALIGRLRAIAPDVRILAMSWSDALEHAAITGGADGFVRKTFRSNDLVAAVVAATRSHDLRPVDRLLDSVRPRPPSPMSPSGAAAQESQ